MTKIGTEIYGFEGLAQNMRLLSVAMREKVTRAAIEAPAKVAAQRMRELCPSSAETGTRKWWAKSTAASRATATKLRDTIGYEIRNYGWGMIAYVGPQLPGGSLINILYTTAEKVLWGKETGAYKQSHNFVAAAGDETAARQKAAAESAAASALKKQLTLFAM